MYISRIGLTNFRSYSEAEFEFTPGVNILIGTNGSGKTTVLEAVHVLSISRSFRTHNDRNLIQKEADHFFVEGTQTHDNQNKSFKIGYSRNGQKRVFIDGRQLGGLRELLGQLPLVVLSPEDIVLIQGGYIERRSYIDRILSVTNGRYLSELFEYRHILKQRNAAIKTSDGNQSLVQIWNETFAERMINIWRMRDDFINEFVDYFRDVWEEHGLSMTASIHYENGQLGTKEKIMMRLSDCWNDDLRMQRSNVGPHRDKIIFRLRGKDARYFGSMGEQKLLLASLKLAEARYLHEKIGTSPILLLDDLFATLDSSRAKQLLIELTATYQAFVTTTAMSVFDKAFLKSSNIKIHKLTKAA